MYCAIISDGTETIDLTDENENSCKNLKFQLKEIIWEEYSNGVTGFYVSCEYGIPLWAAELICELKRNYEVELHIIVPYEEQAAKWREDTRCRYFDVHERSDSVTFARTQFQSDCFKIADRLIINNCSRIVFFRNNEWKIHS